MQADPPGGQLGADQVAGFAISGYAFGALTGGDLMQRFRQRTLFQICEALFVIGCAASAPAHGMVARLAGGARGVLLAALGVTVAFTVFGVLLWIGGGAGLPKPDLQTWIKENKPAVTSPPLLARLRRGR